MWWHCRWATGSERSLWPDIKSLIIDYYKYKSPTDEVTGYVHCVLGLLDEYGISATFFILGEMATLFPELVKEIHEKGHEIACHGLTHTDTTILDRRSFHSQVAIAKQILEDLIGEEVIGFRAPNLVLTPWIFDEICAIGFKYDSSICPSRKIFGKYEGFSSAPNNAFLITINDKKSGKKKYLVELPIPCMPLVKLPACSGIITRIFGYWWTLISINQHIKKGDVMYYFHPYEIGTPPNIDNRNFYLKVFFRNLGKPYEKMLRRIFQKVKRNGSLLARDAVKKLIVNQDKIRPNTFEL